MVPRRVDQTRRGTCTIPNHSTQPEESPIMSKVHESLAESLRAFADHGEEFAMALRKIAAQLPDGVVDVEIQDDDQPYWADWPYIVDGNGTARYRDGDRDGPTWWVKIGTTVGTPYKLSDADLEACGPVRQLALVPVPNDSDVTWANVMIKHSAGETSPRAYTERLSLDSRDCEQVAGELMLARLRLIEWHREQPPF